MFDRFTDEARRAMTRAARHAGSWNSDYIGTEHLILALAEESSGPSAQVLKQVGVDPKRLREELDRIVKPGDRPGPRQLPFTPRMKRVLENALEEAQNLGHSYIGTEHLLLGIVREWKGPAPEALARMGVTADAIRDRVLALLGDAPPAPSGLVWGAVPHSSAVDWAKTARMQQEARRMVSERIPWAASDVDLVLVPRKSGWCYRLSVVLWQRGEPNSSMLLDLRCGRLSDIEEDLPRRIDDLVKMIEGAS